MGRAPCCDQKMGLKKGPWAPEEDHILINYIRLHGHTNWRALPKLAGLLRCGKSCRLRWINYLRPDIKRGDFTREEEESIIELHEMLGNRWSTMAARLPGRTDNEIKNVWHTHLKKRLPKNYAATDSTTTTVDVKRGRKSKPPKKAEMAEELKVDPRPCTTEMSMSTVSTSSSSEKMGGNNGDFGQVNDDFWMEVLSLKDTDISTEEDLHPTTTTTTTTLTGVLKMEPIMFESISNIHDDHDEMDSFWFNLYKEEILL